MEDKGGRQRAWEGGADYSVQGTTGRVTNKHGRKGDQRAWEGGEQTIVSIRIMSGNERKGEQWIGAGGGQTIVSIRVMSGNKRKPGSIFLTRLEKSDLSRDFFPAWITIATEKIFWNRFSLTIFSENVGRTSHLGWNLTENPLGAFLGPVGTSNSVVGCHMCPKTY